MTVDDNASIPRYVGKSLRALVLGECDRNVPCAVDMPRCKSLGESRINQRDFGITQQARNLYCIYLREEPRKMPILVSAGAQNQPVRGA